jgi:hypothetical protein
MNTVLAAAATLVVALATPSATGAEGSPIVVYKADGDYEAVKENVQLAIEGRGLLVRGVSHVSDMLNRTGKDLGFDKEVFLHAESLEFCSAELSHRMVLAHPGNLATCPVTIGVYVLTAEPEQVYVAFRRQALGGTGSEREAVERSLFELVDGIVRDAIE